MFKNKNSEHKSYTVLQVEHGHELEQKKHK